MIAILALPLALHSAMAQEEGGVIEEGVIEEGAVEGVIAEEALEPENSLIEATLLWTRSYDERTAANLLALQGDGSQVLAFDRVGRAKPKAWTRAGDLLPLPSIAENAIGLRWTASGDALVVRLSTNVLGGLRGGLQLVDVASGRLRRFFEAEDIGPVAVGPAGRWLAGALPDAIKLWDLEADQSVLIPGTAGTEALSFVTGGELMIASDDGSRLARLAVPGGEILDSWNGPQREGPVCFSPDGRLLAVGGQGGLRLYDLVGAGQAQRLPAEGAISALAWAPDGRTLVAGSDRGEVRLWSVSGVTGVERSEVRSVSPSAARGPLDEARPTPSPRDALDERLGPGGGRDDGGGKRGIFSSRPKVSVDYEIAVLGQFGGDPRDAESIEENLERNEKMLEPCWRRASRKESLSGEIVLEMAVNVGGEGASIGRPISDTIGNPRLSECLRERLREPLFGAGIGDLEIRLGLSFRASP